MSDLKFMDAMTIYRVILHDVVANLLDQAHRVLRAGQCHPTLSCPMFMFWSRAVAGHLKGLPVLRYSCHFLALSL
jgi:hypothetical protein